MLLIKEFISKLGIDVWTNTSTQSKLSVLSRVFKLYDADPTDLVFYLRDENEGVEDEVGTRYDLRRKYWTYALDYIKKAHGEGGSFSNVNPSKETGLMVSSESVVLVCVVWQIMILQELNGCEELCPLFCDVDDITYGGLKKIGFKRTKNFRLWWRLL